MLPFLLALRPAQWLKNAVVAAGALFALADAGQHLNVADVCLHTLAAVAIFCAVSGAVYIMNDLRDREADCMHPRKKLRPIASGALAPRTAAIGAAVLALASLAASAFLGPAFLVVVAAYFVVQMIYSFGGKRVPFLDVLLLASGFVLRVAAGTAAAHVPVSPWILDCAALGAMLLALLKRRAELVELGDAAPAHRPVLSHYSRRSLRIAVVLVAAVFASTYLSWTRDVATIAKFGPNLIATVPVFVLALYRCLHLAVRRNLGGEPERMARDPILLLLGAAYIAAFVLATR